MRDGLSLFWGQMIPAQEITYTDVADLQMVCPCCREPLLKAVRGHGQGEQDAPQGEARGATHYLAHRPTGAAGEAARFEACERRVASLTMDDITKLRMKSRGQSVARFVEVFAQHVGSVIDRCYAPLPGSAPGITRAPSEIAQDCLRRPAFTMLVADLERNMVPEAMAQVDPNNILKARHEGSDASEMSEWLRHEGIPVSDGMIERASTFISDVTTHLATPQVKASRMALLAAAAWRSVADARRDTGVPWTMSFRRVVAERHSISTFDAMSYIGVAQLEAMLLSKGEDAYRKEMRLLRREAVNALDPRLSRQVREAHADRIMRQSAAMSLVGSAHGLLLVLPFANHMAGLRRKEIESLMPKPGSAPAAEPSISPLVTTSQTGTAPASTDKDVIPVALKSIGIDQDGRSYIERINRAAVASWQPPGHCMVLAGLTSDEAQLVVDRRLPGWRAIRPPAHGPNHRTDPFLLMQADAEGQTRLVGAAAIRRRCDVGGVRNSEADYHLQVIHPEFGKPDDLMLVAECTVFAAMSRLTIDMRTLASTVLSEGGHLRVTYKIPHTLPGREVMEAAITSVIDDIQSQAKVPFEVTIGTPPAAATLPEPEAPTLGGPRLH